MNKYLDNDELFMKPKTEQYGSHMVMTNVAKISKTKLINIDTQFRDEYNYNDTSSYTTTMPDKYKYNISFPEKLTNVKSISIKSVEVPMTFFNISSNFENNYFNITNNTTKLTTTVTVPDGNYNISALATVINNIISAQPNINTISVSVPITGNYSNYFLFTNSSTSVYYTITFATNDKYGFKSSLGWLIGFRIPFYTLNVSSTIYSQYVNNITNPFPKYLYLSVDEFSKGVQNSFFTPIYNAFLTKNVISRITVDTKTYPYGSLLVANLYNGLLNSDHRSYNGKVDLQKLCIQLLNENGAPVDLNGQDISILMEIIYE